MTCQDSVKFHPITRCGIHNIELLKVNYLKMETPIIQKTHQKMTSVLTDTGEAGNSSIVPE